ncbi:T9SS type A sorting domain-containing protein [candidate division WOR-3 bacterium]|nr:T9SS type A sorting domain-containing protein [candidate division WOR-3 bacterium]
MKRVLIFTGLVVFTGSLSAGNFVFNPSFDMTPWDTGWTIDTTIYNSHVEADSSKCYSGHRSCNIVAEKTVSISEAGAIFQKVPKVINCTCRVYYQYFINAKSIPPYYVSSAIAAVRIYVKINGRWECEWTRKVIADSIGEDTTDEISTWTKWEKVYDSKDTVSCIKFHSTIPLWGYSFYAYASFWIDDIYISGEEIGVEENNEIANYKLQVYPNPFMKSIEFRVESSELKDSKLEIHDISGRIVRKLSISNKQSAISNVKWDGKGEEGIPLPGGIYFAKLITKGDKQSLKLILLK